MDFTLFTDILSYNVTEKSKAYMCTQKNPISSTCILQNNNLAHNSRTVT